MRLSEKTLELSITSQLTHRFNAPRAIWFGLTQQQERHLGFDVCSTVTGRLLILQFKASSVMVHPRRYQHQRRRFTLPHQQLDNLQRLAQAFPGSVYYVFPQIGTTNELAVNQDLIGQTWLLDVVALPRPFPMPTNRSQVHHAFVDPPDCEICSEPIETKLLGQREFVQKLRAPVNNSHDMVAWLRRHEFSFHGARAYGFLLPIPA